MKRESVLELQEDALRAFDKRSLGRPRTTAATEAEVVQAFEKRLAIGYSLTGKDDYRLEVRVQRDTGPAFAYAEELREKHGGEVNVVVLDAVMVPPNSEVEEAGPTTLRRQQVLRPGISLSRIDSRAGTLGLLVQCEDGDGLITASHVIAQSGEARTGDWIYHPGKPDVSPLSMKCRIARLADAVELSSDEINTLDAAIASLVDGVQHDGNKLPELGSPVDGKSVKGVLSLAELEALGSGIKVAKVGRTTGYTEGTLTALNVRRLPVRTQRGNHSFGGVFEITWASARKPFSRPGDSGAAVFVPESLRAFGMHFASDHVRTSYACALPPILDQFGARLIV